MNLSKSNSRNALQKYFLDLAFLSVSGYLADKINSRVRWKPQNLFKSRSQLSVSKRLATIYVQCICRLGIKPRSEWSKQAD